MSVIELNAIAPESSRSFGVQVLCLVRVMTLPSTANVYMSRTGRSVKKQKKNCMARMMKKKRATVNEMVVTIVLAVSDRTTPTHLDHDTSQHDVTSLRFTQDM